MIASERGGQVTEEGEEGREGSVRPSVRPSVAPAIALSSASSSSSLPKRNWGVVCLSHQEAIIVGGSK
jgi:hypothetical protein